MNSPLKTAASVVMAFSGLAGSVGIAQAQKSDTELLAETRGACMAWVSGADSTPAELQQFCDCLLLNIAASIPSIPELERLVADFGIPALREFSQRPQGAQDMDICFR